MLISASPYARMQQAGRRAETAAVERARLSAANAHPVRYIDPAVALAEMRRRDEPAGSGRPAPVNARLIIPVRLSEGFLSF